VPSTTASGDQDPATDPLALRREASVVVVGQPDAPPLHLSITGSDLGLMQPD
jgi:hypothetical protein